MGKSLEITDNELLQSLNTLENPYSFSDKQFTVENASSLVKSSILRSNMGRAEIEWCLNRLKMIDNVRAILPEHVEILNEYGHIVRDSKNNPELELNEYKYLAIQYTLRSVLDRAILSRTKDGWFAKMIYGYKTKESNKNETDSLKEVLAKTDTEIENDLKNGEIQ